MKISKAIEILTQNTPYGTNDKSFDFRAAIQLGIEALKVLQRQRLPHDTTYTGLLPGEDPQ